MPADADNILEHGALMIKIEFKVYKLYFLASTLEQS